jgi:hypothetical protein
VNMPPLRYLLALLLPPLALLAVLAIGLRRHLTRDYTVRYPAATITAAQRVRQLRDQS